MARNEGTVIVNKFTRGFIDQATGLNFPEDAVTDCDNVRFDVSGFFERRLGIDIEGSGQATPIPAEGAIVEFVWHSVSQNGEYTFLVLQLGDQVTLYEVSTVSLSGNKLTTTIDLNDYKAAGAGQIGEDFCDFASGNGWLFVTHPLCDPILVRFKSDEELFEAARVELLQRDFEGIETDLSVSEEPTILSDEHLYNLKNQGWAQRVRIGDNTEKETGDTFITEPTYYKLSFDNLPA